MFFPIPIALVYLRWGSRASWMSALVSGLLLSVLMGPTRSILFVIPFGIMGVQLGACGNVEQLASFHQYRDASRYYWLLFSILVGLHFVWGKTSGFM
jgi:uncharacterized protein YybS (DUF2232 family)